MSKKRNEDDLSDLLEPQDATPRKARNALDLSDRIFVFIDAVDTVWLFDEADPNDLGLRTVEYIRADALREGFTGKIWQAATQFARRTAGQPTSALQRARDLIEEGR